MAPVIATLALAAAGAPESVGVGEANPVAEIVQPGHSIQLSDEDLQQITEQVLKHHPLLASSAGIKHAEAYGWTGTSDSAQVIFLPHAESAGVKYSYQTSCWRETADDAWTCSTAQLRRYMKLDSQEFELRVRSDIGTREALALVEATREMAITYLPELPPDEVTAVMIVQCGSKFFVSWGRPEGYMDLSLVAALLDGRSGAEPGDWEAELFVSENE